MRRLTALLGAIFLSPAVALAQLVTSQYDNARTGAYTRETQLSPETVASRFGKLFSLAVDGDVYAQPLYLARVPVASGNRDLLFVATENDDVYAFDATRFSTAPVWHVRFADPAHGIVPIPSRDLQCPFIKPVVGISATPVIDSVAGTLYVLARAKETDGGVAHYTALD